MRLLKRKPRTFEIQVQDMTLHIQAATDVDEESRAAALSFWEVLHAYSIRDPAFRESKRPVTVPDLTPGEHAVSLESAAGSVKQVAAIEAGITASLMVPLSSG